MVSIKEHINKVITNMLSVVHTQPYYDMVISSIEKELNLKFNSDDIILMSTAEHFAVMNHFKTCSNILTISSSDYWNNHKNNNTYFIILADSLIPLDNADYPRGIILNSSSETLYRYPLFSSKYRKSFPFYIHDVKIKPAEIHVGPYPFKQTNILSSIRDIFRNQNSFDKQVSETNIFLYNKILSNRICKPKLKYLLLEPIAVALLLILLENNDPFCEEFILHNHERTYKYLEGTRTCWGLNKGSFLFWHNDNGKLLPCRLHKDRIISEKSTFCLRRDDLISYLKQKVLLPGAFLSLCVTSILPSFATIGGVPQSYFLQKMIDYINHFYPVGINSAINNFNWGIHPDISPFINGKVKTSTAIYLSANPPESNQIDDYLTKTIIQI